MTLRCTEDLLAAVPVTLGFVPHESVVMLAVVGPRCFQARVDLPAPGVAAELALVVEALVAPAVAHRARRVAFVLYSGERVHATRVARALETAMRRHGVEVFDAVRVHGSRWWPARGRRGAVPAEGVPFEVSAHPFAAQAVLAGQVVLGSRADLAATLSPVAEVVRDVEERISRAAPGRGLAPARTRPRRSAGGGWPRSWRGTGSSPWRPGPTLLARLLPALRDTAVRDAAVCAVPPTADGAGARADAAFWVEVVRRSPPGLRVAPAALLALAAWNAGQGALAWCAVDVARRAQADYPLTELVAELLERAVPPGSWRPGGEAPDLR